MEPGLAAQIQYVAADGTPWQAALGEVRLGLVAGSTSDPEFLHRQGDSKAAHYPDAWIFFKAPDGGDWSARCRSHLDAVNLMITFKFELWRQGAESRPPEYISDELFFLDWEGKPWVAKVNPMDSPGVPGFVLQRVN